MVRKTDIQRDTRPRSPKLFKNPNEKAILEARNGLLQFDEVIRLIDEPVISGAFKLKPSMIQNLHRIAIKDIYTCAGNYRTRQVEIRHTDHKPPEWIDVPRLVEDMCEYVNDNWRNSAICLSAYIMWRINWIHPFMGGNGRTARAVSYLVLCKRLGYKLPGAKTIPDQIVDNREPYYQALDAADAKYAKSRLDVSEMESLLSDMLAVQLYEVIQEAKTGGALKRKN